MTGIQLDLLTDIDTHLFIEKGLRGGISMITHRHAEANNPYVPGYDPNKDTEYIAYLDANNLYGWVMSQSLPTHSFCWLNDKEKDNIDVTGILDDSQMGYILEVDLDYPREIHDLHNDYPLAPERIQVTPDMLSPYASKLLELKGTSTEKLVPNLNPKTKYVLHYRNLKQYLSLGMKLTKVHRVLSFQQSPWLKTYIEFNKEKRKVAKNDFEKDFYKLMNNSVFGKTMENLRKRVDVKLVNSHKKAKKLTCKPSFHAFSEELVAVHMLKQKLYLNRPIYVGFSILDISKTLMYDFHYNHVKSKYGSNAILLFTDTDSLAYSLRTNDLYEDMLQDQHLFDTSEYDKEHPLYSLTNKKVLGKMKDEAHGNAIHAFIGLKSKMYAYDKTSTKQVNGELMKTTAHVETERAKGIKKNVYQQYKQCLFGRTLLMSNMTQIRSYDHQLYNININKIGLSPFDDKRYLLDDGITSFAYGHWRISGE